jgi:hypothetical protein
MINVEFYDKSKDNFVGFRFEKSSFKLYLPIGIDIDDSIRSIPFIHKIFSKYVKHNKNNNSVSKNFVKSDDTINIIFKIANDFLNRGLYKPKYKLYNKVSGKVNYKKTVQYSKFKGVLTEKDFIFSKTEKVENYVSKLHLNAINYCLSLVYPNIKYKKITLDNLNKQKINKLILDEINKTYNDSDIKLLQSLYNFYSEVFFSSVKINRISEYGTYDFEYIWEHIIEKVFGNFDVTKIMPKATWHFYNGYSFDSSNMRVDTIHLSKNEAYIIDSKYYKYGVTKNYLDLPLTKDVEKQLTYMKYSSLFFKNKNVINLFFLPSLLKLDKSNEFILNIGYAKVNWEVKKEDLEVKLVLIDTMKVIEKYINNQKISLSLNYFEPKSLP